MKKRILAILIAMGISIPTYASISVSPTKIELNANKIRNNYATCAIEVKGDEKVPMRFKAYSGYFTITDQSTMNIHSTKDDPHDISKKVRFVPSEFTVPPGKVQKLRVNVANIKSLPDGESRALLFIEDVNVREVEVANTMGIGAQLVLKTRVGIPIYVDKGKFTKRADVEYFNIVQGKDGKYTEMKILSTGNSRVRYGGKFQIIKDKKLICEYAIDGKAVGDNNHYVARQKIPLDKLTESGEYTLRMILTYSDENANRKIIKKDAILKITGEI